MVKEDEFSEKSHALAEAYVRLAAKKFFGPLKFPNLEDDENQILEREKELLQYHAKKQRMKLGNRTKQQKGAFDE